MSSIPWLTVITIPRRPFYLANTLAELDRAGAAALAARGLLRRVIAVDGYPNEVMTSRSGWEVLQVGTGRAGNRRAMAQIFKLAAAADAAELLYFEDDVICSVDAVLALYHYPIPPRCGFVTGFVFREDLQSGDVIRDAKTLLGTNPPRTKGFWGTQAIKVSGPALQYLRAVQVREHEPPMSCDVWLGDQVASTGQQFDRFSIIRPSIFQHQGPQSISHPDLPGDLRRAIDFDPALNALSVLPHGTRVIGRSGDTTPMVDTASLAGLPDRKLA